MNLNLSSTSPLHNLFDDEPLFSFNDSFDQKLDLSIASLAEDGAMKEQSMDDLFGLSYI